jgi:predicted nuclease of restriction endonuclease-like (RecB) superfamily
MALATKGHEVQKPEDLVKDPYVLEFAGIHQECFNVHIFFSE